ncbi:hypothetical protein EZV73_10845 [Acidaminobacter sp. JC074]|uniref:uridine kinase family protein n=1 Tax=Acidaminobacter sp. JC074 TaxID=2530199 RepID=UPI001F10A7DF|nr:hypothetical protein [Acidaminobacter sp. JC074]MCH4888075.1 hypothetical protein [Acidaminobacter sp. JC074]
MNLSDQSSLLKKLEKCSLVSISFWKEKGLPLEWLKKLSDLTQACSGVEFEKWLQEVAGGYEVSNDFKISSDKEGQKFYIVDNTYTRLIPLLEKISNMDSDYPFVISFDGPAGSGKTTLAGVLGKVLESSVVHMDDFFLPPNLRSEERLDQAGGNVHYERFKDQVVDHLRSGRDFSYTRFDCRMMDYTEELVVKSGPFIIVEGSYSRHPYFGDYSDLNVYCLVTESDQRDRIERRNGKDKLKVFESKWIPMENKYLKTFKIKEKSHILL